MMSIVTSQFLSKPLYCVMWSVSTLHIFGINKESVYIYLKIDIHLNS